MKSTISWIAAAVAVLGMSAATAQDIKVGVTLSATGPAASLGIPERNTFPLCRKPSAGKRSTTSCSTTHRIRRPRFAMRAS